jgi:hypothetical protein
LKKKGKGLLVTLSLGNAEKQQTEKFQNKKGKGACRENKNNFSLILQSKSYPSTAIATITNL